MKPAIVVVGSANTDFVVHVSQLPARGETILGGQFQIAQGGKGANQAVAAARLGGEVTFIARLGADNLGREALQAYRDEGVHTGFVRLDEVEPSGVALILVDENGENLIAVAPGANHHLSPEDVQAAESAIRKADCLLLQLEIPLETARTAIEIADHNHVRTILNPAPARRIPFDFFQHIDILTPNEMEAATLAGELSSSEERDPLSFLAIQTNVPTLIETLGSNGARVLSNGQESYMPAFQVKPVDTTAAGDAFNGALVVALASGRSMAEAVRYANAAGALATTRAGAQPSLPTQGELEQFLSNAQLKEQIH